MDSPEAVRAFLPLLEATSLPRQVSVPSGKAKGVELSSKLISKPPLIAKSVYETSYGEITLWKINEWAFSSSAEKLPCYARGLFTSNDRILIRGYNKFFNVGEQVDYEPSQIELKTAGPYHASVKENGCIIFFSGLPGGELLTASKRALGKTLGGVSKHADAGEAALRKQLNPDEVKELAQYLYDEGLTVVCEYCDDRFEEHVLSYDDNEAGLYLHGINYNSIEFKSKTTEEIKQFGERWRFRNVQSLEFETFGDFMDLMKESVKTGTYNGKETEGFVVRCTKLQDGLTFFFKFKFDEPYLFYRKLRELTTEYISGGASMDDLKKKSKKGLSVIVKYLDFIEEYFKDDQHLEQWKNGRGVIAVRRAFAESLGKSGMDLLEYGSDNSHDLNEPIKPVKGKKQSTPKLNQCKKPQNIPQVVPKSPDNARGIINTGKVETKYVIASLATPGSGKTTAFKTVENLFSNFSHVQNDDLENTSRVFSNLIRMMTLGADAVFFDKNNHQRRERELLLAETQEASKSFYPDGVDIKFICCNFQFSDVEAHRKLTYARILKRGDNHQSISAQTEPDKALKIASGFISRTQKLDVTRFPDSKFDLVINLSVTPDDESSLNNAKTIVKSLHQLYPDLVKQIPSDEDFKKSFEKALSYEPEFRKTVSSQKKRQKEKQSERKQLKELEVEKLKIMTDDEKEKALKEKEEQKKKQKEINDRKQKDAAAKQKAKQMKMSWATYFGASILHPEELKKTIDKYIHDDPTWTRLNAVSRVQDDFHVTLMHSVTARGGLGKKIWLFYSEKMESISRLLEPTDPEMMWPLKFYYDIRLDELVIAENYLICFKVTLLKSYNEDGEPKESPNTCAITHITVGTADESIKPFKLNAVLRHLVLRPGSDFAIDNEDEAKYVGSSSTKVKVIKLGNIVLIKQPLAAFRQTTAKVKKQKEGENREKNQNKKDENTNNEVVKEDVNVDKEDKCDGDK